jgi:hypothetical protein
MHNTQLLTIIVGHAIIPIPYIIQNTEPIELTSLNLYILSIVNEYNINIVPIYPNISIIE